MRAIRRAAFTLVEVMIALAILGMGLVILVKSVAGNVSAAASSFYMGVATDLARGKMYDLEEKILDEGFQDAEQEEEGDFSEEGWPKIAWQAVIEPVELPSYDKLVALQSGAGGGSGSGSDGDGEAATDTFQSSALGGMMGMFGGGGGGADSAQGAQTGGFIQAQYTLIQEVLKASIRKITLTVTWSTGIANEHMDVILYVTDPAGMQKTLGSLGL
ncbi:MAG: type II secretion system protein [Myxococcales bacterium]|nr:type II secretion system protein [Myxococcales bacterium]